MKGSWPVILASLLLAAAAAARTQFDYTTNADDTTITITDYIGSAPDVTVPSIINSFTVASIAYSAFSQIDHQNLVILRIGPISRAAFMGGATFFL